MSEKKVTPADEASCFCKINELSKQIATLEKELSFECIKVTLMGYGRPGTDVITEAKRLYDFATKGVVCD